MDHASMTIQGRRFDLNPASDLEQLRKVALDAIQGGGAIIEIPVEGGGQVSVLLSGGIPVFLETHAQPEQTGELWGEPFDDFGYQIIDWE